MFKVAVFETYEILEMKLNTNKVFFIDFFCCFADYLVWIIYNNMYNKIQ